MYTEIYFSFEIMDKQPTGKEYCMRMRTKYVL